ncbi:MAG: serine--tRNA ligase, partial [Candidatus Nanohaloarchaea archaeon]|nr:serine--tRNA ligase [Candidatus Nanohaloarchaea archaeon]
MIDIETFRNNPDKIKQSEKRRDKDPERVDRVIELDRKWRDTLQQADELRQERNRTSEKIAELKKQGKDAEDKIQRMEEVKEKIAELEEKEQELKEKRDELRYRIGNIMHDSVPKGEDEDDNVEISSWEPEDGKKSDGTLAADLLTQHDLVDNEKAAAVAGERAYYLKKDLFYLNQALIRFAMDYLDGQGYTPMQT